jgi:anti-sigma factor RsiW
MTCKEFVELVTEYVEGTLPGGDRARFEDHMLECPWCERYLEQMRVTIQTVGRVDEASISPDARDALLHAFRDWNEERQPS